MKRGGPIGKIAVALLLIAGGTFLGLILAELVVALCYPQKVRVTQAVVNFFVQYDQDIGWINRKNVTGQLKPPDDRLPTTRISINAEGFRGKLVPLPKPTGRKRIVILGDSNAFGYGVDEQVRFSEILERLLRGYDVLNLGVFGYGTDQEAMLLESRGLQFSPDLVAIAFSPNDLADNMSSINTGVSKPYFRVAGKNLAIHNTPVPEPSKRTLVRQNNIEELLYRRSHLYRLMYARLSTSKMFMPDSVFEMSKEEGLQVTVAILEGMNRVCKENGSKFVVLLLSHGDWVDALAKKEGKEVGYYQPLVRMLQGRGISVIDTTPAFVDERKRGKQLFFPKDPVHLTTEGHRVAADVLYDGLTSQDLLK